uniref:Uncharacterized protein n=2 Tax=Lotharella globosa TaxID=91324 RepID=A0A7S3Z0H2_9EUKA
MPRRYSIKLTNQEHFEKKTEGKTANTSPNSVSDARVLSSTLLKSHEKQSRSGLGQRRRRKGSVSSFNSIMERSPRPKTEAESLVELLTAAPSEPIDPLGFKPPFLARRSSGRSVGSGSGRSSRSSLQTVHCNPLILDLPEDVSQANPLSTRSFNFMDRSDRRASLRTDRRASLRKVKNSGSASPNTGSPNTERSTITVRANLSPAVFEKRHSLKLRRSTRSSEPVTPQTARGANAEITSLSMAVRESRGLGRKIRSAEPPTPNTVRSAMTGTSMRSTDSKVSVRSRRTRQAKTWDELEKELESMPAQPQVQDQQQKLQPLLPTFQLQSPTLAKISENLQDNDPPKCDDSNLDDDIIFTDSSSDEEEGEEGRPAEHGTKGKVMEEKDENSTGTKDIGISSTKTNNPLITGTSDTCGTTKYLSIVSNIYPRIEI